MSRLVKSDDRHLRGRDIRLINPENEQLGIVPFPKAIEAARNRGMDLVLVADQANPPVCRIMNYGKYVYERNKQGRNQKKKNVSQKNKEIKFHTNIDPHDYGIKLRHIREFLVKGYKVKVSLFFRGREFRNQDQGVALLEKVGNDVHDIGVVEAKPKLVGRNVSMMVVPNSQK